MVILIAAIFWREIGSRYVYNSMRFVRYIIATQIIVLLWVPIRVHHNLVTKNLIFGNEEPVSKLDIIAYPVVMVLLAVSIYRSWKFEASFLAGVVSLLVVLGFIFISTFNPNLVGLAFGLNSDPLTWFLWPILCLLIIYFVYSDILSKNEGR